MFNRLLFICILFSGAVWAEGRQVLDKVVAVVNNSIITESELKAQVELSKKQLQAQNVQMPSDTVLRKQVLQHLIDLDLQTQLAKQSGIVVDNNELNAAIEKVANVNKLTLSQLREEIVKQGMSWQEYRQNFRKEMLISRLQQKAVGKDAQISNEIVEQYLKSNVPVDNSKQTYHLQNIVVPLGDEATLQQIQNAQHKAKTLLEKIQKGADFARLATDESNSEFILEAGDLGERHLSELPEIFAKEVVTMKVGQVSGPLRTGNGFQLIKLQAIGGIEQHHKITKTHVRHILFKPAASMLPAESKQQAENIYQQLKSGKDFAAMAKQYSLDAASAIKGGDLGWVSPGELVPEFEKTMEHLAIHQISRPVKTQFGWHIIEVLARKEQDDSVAFKKQQVRQFLQQRKFNEAVQNWQHHLRAEAYVNIVDKELA